MMNPGTALGIAATQLAQQGQYKPFTSDGKPTVVAKNLAEISQREAAKQAGIAQQIEAMKMAQMQQAIKQMAAKQTSSPMASGIGSLPGDVAEPQGMAEGGVVGYSGLDGSDVKLDVEQILKKAPAARTPEENAALRAAGVALSSRQMGPESGIVSQLNRVLSGPFIREAITGGALNLSDEELAKRSDTGAMTERMFRGLGGTKATVAPTMAPETAPQAMRTEDAFATPRIDQPVVSRTPAPAPAGPRRTPTATTQGATPAMSLPFPDTRESTAVNPSEAAIQFALARGDIKALGERLSKPTPETPEQQAYRKAQEEQYNRGIAAIDRQRQRFEAAARAGDEARKDQPMENLISRLARVGGAGSLARGLGQAQIGMEPIIAAQRAAEKAANEKKIQYFDLLDQRQETVEDRRLAMLKGDADRVAAETARLRAVDAEIAKLQIGIGEKEAGQRLTGEQAEQRTRMEIDARAAEARRKEAHDLKVEGIRAAAREGTADVAQKRLALQQLKADPEYTAAMNKIKELSKAAGLSSAPTVQAAFRTAQQEALAIARRYGLTPQDIGAAAADTGAASAGQRVVDFASIK